MGAVRKYHVTHNGHRTIMRLNDTDVKNYPDAELVGDDQADTSSEGTEAKSTAGKTRTPADKSRRTAGDKASG